MLSLTHQHIFSLQPKVKVRLSVKKKCHKWAYNNCRLNQTPILPLKKTFEPFRIHFKLYIHNIFYICHKFVLFVSSYCISNRQQSASEATKRWLIIFLRTQYQLKFPKRSRKSRPLSAASDASSSLLRLNDEQQMMNNQSNYSLQISSAENVFPSN